MVNFIYKQKDLNNIIVTSDLNSALSNKESQMFMARIRDIDIFLYRTIIDDVDQDTIFI